MINLTVCSCASQLGRVKISSVKKSIWCFCSLEQKHHFLLFQHKWLRLIGVFILPAVDGNDGEEHICMKSSFRWRSVISACCVWLSGLEANGQSRVVIHLVIWCSPYVTLFDTSICSGWEYTKCGLSSTRLQNTARALLKEYICYLTREIPEQNIVFYFENWSVPFLCLPCFPICSSIHPNTAPCKWESRAEQCSVTWKQHYDGIQISCTNTNQKMRPK